MAMQLAIGQRLSEGTLTLGVDPFSWATEAQGRNMPPTFWVHQSWLYSWAFYQLYLFIGGPGLVLGKAILFTVAVALLSRIGWNEANRWFVVICLTMAVLCVSPRLLLQPTVESDDRFALKIHERYEAGKGEKKQVADVLHLYRYVGRRLVEATVNSVAADADAVKAEHGDAEEALLSATGPGVKARKPSSKPAAKP